jgi:hypothetical protein
MTDFSPFLDAYGNAIDAEPATQNVLRAYQGVVPEQLIEFWERYGFGGYAKGMIWITEPTLLEDVLAKWLPPKRSARAIPVARTAFGNIVYWHKDKYTFLDVHYAKEFEAGTDTELLFAYYLVDETPRRSVLQQPKFEEALKAQGQLHRDEMYAFTLPLVLGGADDLKNMTKAKMREQLAILVSLHGKGGSRSHRKSP